MCIKKWFGLISLFNGIPAFGGYLKSIFFYDFMFIDILLDKIFINFMCINKLSLVSFSFFV